MPDASVAAFTMAFFFTLAFFDFREEHRVAGPLLAGVATFFVWRGLGSL